MEAALSRADNAAAVIMAASARGWRRPVVEHCAAGSMWILTAFQTKHTQQTATAPEETIFIRRRDGKGFAAEEKSCQIAGMVPAFSRRRFVHNHCIVPYLQILGP
jgi:hypothetical protein